MFSFFKYILCEDKLTCILLLIRTVIVFFHEYVSEHQPSSVYAENQTESNQI